MIRSDLRTYVLAQPSVAALLDDRMHLCRLPQKGVGDVWLTYRRISGNYDHDLQGGADRADPQFEFDFWGADPDEVEAAGEAVRLTIYAAAGQTIGDGDGTFIHEVVLEDEKDFYHASKVADDVGRHRTQYRYKIGHTVARPS